MIEWLPHGVRYVIGALAAGNRIKPLIGGGEAYPAMLAAIDGARESIVRKWTRARSW